jgi:hypothetical protein
MKNNFPAGLIDDKIEFFIDCNDVYIIEYGVTMPFETLTPQVHNLLVADLKAHPAASFALYKMGITDPIQRLKQYVKCRYAACNGSPDLTREGGSNSEFYDCGVHNNCRWEGKLCALIQAPFGFLTPREVEIAKFIGLGALDKEIAVKLNISVFTVQAHRRNLEMKIKPGGTKVDVARFAIENNII